MRTIRSLPYRVGVSVRGFSVRETPWIETPVKEHGTRDRDPLQKEHGTRDRTPLEGTWYQAARQEVKSYREPLPLWTEWQTRVKTLPCPKLRLRAVNTFSRIDDSAYIWWGMRSRAELTEHRHVASDTGRTAHHKPATQSKHLITNIARYWTVVYFLNQLLT